jgi:hypothetical protein
VNPDNLDLLQVVRQGGGVVWNIQADGNYNFNPAHPTKLTLLGQYFAPNVHAAFPKDNSTFIMAINLRERLVWYITIDGVSVLL